MAAHANPTAKTPTEIWAVLFDESARLSDAQLLVLVLGMGTTRSAKGRVKKTWTAIELAGDLLTTAGGRLEHLVASARRADFDLRHFGLGKILGSRQEARRRYSCSVTTAGEPTQRESAQPEAASSRPFAKIE